MPDDDKQITVLDQSPTFLYATTVHGPEVEGLARCEPVPEMTEPDFKIFNTAEICWNTARVKYPEMAPWGARPDCEDVAALVATYATTRQWSPLPAGTEAANDKVLQQVLCDIVSTLVPVGSGNFLGSAQVLRKGWKSGTTQPRHTEHEVKAAVRMGYAAMEAQHGRSMRKVSEEELREMREKAALVLTLAKIHQMDAVRVALLEHKIDPRFSGPIVADVCFGMLTRVV